MDKFYNLTISSIKKMGSKTSKISKYESHFKETFENDLKRFNYVDTTEEGLQFVDFINNKYFTLFFISIRYHFCKDRVNVQFACYYRNESNFYNDQILHYNAIFMTEDDTNIGEPIYKTIKMYYENGTIKTNKIACALALLSTKQRNAILI